MDEVAIAALLYRYARAVDTAQVRAMFYHPMQLPGMAELSYCGGYYHHALVRTPDGWCSRHLREENVWFTNTPAAAPEAHM